MLTKLTQEQAQEIWEHIWMQDEIFNKDFVGQIPKLLQLLVSKIVNEDEADIGISKNGEIITANMISGGKLAPVKGLASCLTYNESDKNNRLELYYDKKGKFTIYLYIGMFDEKEYSNVLTPDLVEQIPSGLINQMKKALKQEDTLLVKANMLE